MWSETGPSWDKIGPNQSLNKAQFSTSIFGLNDGPTRFSAKSNVCRRLVLSGTFSTYHECLLLWRFILCRLFPCYLNSFPAGLSTRGFSLREDKQDENSQKHCMAFGDACECRHWGHLGVWWGLPGYRGPLPVSVCGWTKTQPSVEACGHRRAKYTSGPYTTEEVLGIKRPWAAIYRTH